jgi:hypothetical protein
MRRSVMNGVNVRSALDHPLVALNMDAVKALLADPVADFQMIGIE